MNDLIDHNSQKSRLGLEYAGVLLVVGVLYVLTVAPGPLWQDNGMAQVRVLNHDYVGDLGLALAHPLFYLAAQAFQILPLGSSALKTNLVAAVFGTFTVANVYLLLSLLLKNHPMRRPASLLGAISLALAHTFWQHAALAEVYSVSTAILSLELVLLVRFEQTGRVDWWLAAIFLNGLECANHMLAFVSLAPILFWSLWLVWQKKLFLRWFVPAIVLWIIGALPYEYLGYQAWQGGESFGQVLYSMCFGVAGYQKDVLNVALRPILLITTLGVLVLNFPTPNLLLIPLGMFRIKKIVSNSFAGLLAMLTIFHLLFAMRYPVRDQYTFFIIAIVLLSVWLGLGSADFMLAGTKRKVLTFILAFLPLPVYAMIPSIVLHLKPDFAHPPIPYRDEASYFFQPWKFGYHGPERLVREVFELAGPDAIVLADSTAVRPFEYTQMTSHVRPDVTVTESLYDDVPDESRRIELLSQTLTSRQVFIVRPYPHYAPDWILKNFKIVPAGPIYRIIRD
jgi:hypothetical protein